MAETYFDQLGLSPTSNIGDIENAYQQKKLEAKGDPHRLRLIEQAYRTLGNPIKLNNYLQDMHPAESTTPDLGDFTPAAGQSERLPSASQINGTDRIGTKRHSTRFIETDEPIKESPLAFPDGKAKSGRRKTEIYDPETIISRPPGRQPGAGAPPAFAQKRQRTEMIDDVRIPGSFPPEPASRDKKRNPAGTSQTAPMRSQNSHRVHVVYEYGGEQKEYDLKEGKNIIGRPPLNGSLPDIPLPDPEQFISRCHAVITIEGTQITLMDSSGNGTSLNGKRIPTSQPFPLKNEDVIEIEKRLLRIHIS
jgi:pSer/pThr/pTyr-binding forkhead associated (FHA) protein